MSIEQTIQDYLRKALLATYHYTIKPAEILLRPAPDHFTGSHTFATFSLAKKLQHSSNVIAETLGKWLLHHTNHITNYQVVQGFLNLELADQLWLTKLKAMDAAAFCSTPTDPQTILIEFSSPNTNKPLHLGHLRNNSIGYTLAQLMKKLGHKVYMVNTINDRGIHICKSMLAYKKWGNQETPESTGIKGDHLVGKYYVLFEKAYQQQVQELIRKHGNQEKAKQEAPLLQEAKIMLKEWEEGKEEIIALWKKMNGWVYEGFEITYQKTGISFDRVYYESATYLNGKKIIEEGLQKKVFYQQKDNSIWADLQAEKLDKKLLLRADGTAVYITQDIGLIEDRYEQYTFDKHIYVVGNEQNYHFKVLFSLLKRLDRPYAQKLYHLSYGMVELPNGKMKSREGTAVDADDLIEQMVALAKKQTDLLGKTQGFSQKELDTLYHTIGIGAIKYFLLKVNPQKNILFDPASSIDLQGNTAPFIQYTYARIASLLAKTQKKKHTFASCIKLNEALYPTEKEVIIRLVGFTEHLQQAAQTHNPSLLCTYAYDLAKTYNRLYATHTILQEKEEHHRNKRLYLSQTTAHLLKQTMELLGIHMPERM